MNYLTIKKLKRTKGFNSFILKNIESRKLVIKMKEFDFPKLIFLSFLVYILVNYLLKFYHNT